ncbi:hypothetical protein [Ferruginibacter sp.]|uniref:hypothetical protein n=1 Tax=Ferruginibacter sp. TaxID=1940288 RepID=UPI002658E831|nr:hypothetical protein [Ferruginibacter sp.]
MQKIILFIYGIINLNVVSAQNLVVNQDAESLPRGTGWSIISQGGVYLFTGSYQQFC